MLPFDEKKAHQAVVQKHLGAKGAKAPAAPEVEIDGKHAAAHEILAAMHEKNPKKLSEALSNFHDIHSMKSGLPKP